jgi:PDZ domain-containing protein
MVTGDEGGLAPQAPKRRWRWWMTVLAALVILAIAAAFVRLPYETVAPGTARQVNDLLSVEGTKVYPPDGKLYYATVAVRDEVSPYEVLRAWIDDDIDLMSSRAVRGSLSPDRFRQLNIEAMANSKDAAEVVALLRLGIDAASGKGALVTEVAPDFPAASVLRVDDLIVAVDGKKVELAEDAIAAIRAHRPGDQVQLRIIRGGGQERDVGTTLKAGTDGTARLGVGIETKDFKIDSPYEITIDSGRVVGPSAGVAYALEVIDLLTPGELTGGRKVAATGELSNLSGDVGEIGGVAQKTVTVQRAGAEVFLVPRANYDEAKSRARKGLIVIPIDTIDDALRALGDFEGSNAPTYALSGPKGEAE